MNWIRFSKLAAIAAMAAGSLGAQNAIVTLQAGSPKVLVSATMQVAASITALDGTPLDTGTLTWNSSNPSAATVSPTGLIAGLAPGDSQIAVADQITGATAWVMVHIVPKSMSLQASAATIAAGETTALTATAVDAAGKAIPGVRFVYRSGESSVATVSSDGVVTGVAEGLVTIEAAIAGVASDAALIATARVRVLPKPRFKVRKLLSTDTASATTLAAVATVSATSPSVMGAIVTLANGGQAAVLLESGRTKVIAAAGQQLPSTGRLVLRIDGISTNSHGDIALLIEYPTQWCTASVFLFPHGQPEMELGAANCGNGLAPHSMGEDGAVLYRYNDQIWSASAKGAPTLLFSLATQPALKDPLKSVNNFTAGGGAFIIAGTMNSNVGGYFWSDGTAFVQVYRTGDAVRSTPTFNMDLPVGSAAGLFYARASGNNFESLVQLGSFGLKALLVTGDNIAVGKLGWIHSLADASTAGVLFAGDFNVPNNYHTGAGLWKSDATTELVPLAGWGSIISGALPTDGIAVLSAVLKDDTQVPGLRVLDPQSGPRVLLQAGANFPQPVPAGIDWHYPSRGGSASALPVRAAGEAIVVVDSLVDSTVHVIAAIGAALPNGKIATAIGAANSNSAGDIVFTANYSTGSALFRYRGGQLETLGDSGAASIVGLATPSYFQTWRGRYLATNNRGDVVHVSQYQNGSIPEIVMITGGAPKLVAALNTQSPAGVSYSNFNSIAVDENGHVLFSANTVDGKSAAYFWDGSSVTRVIGTGDQTSTGTLNELSNIGGAGQGFVIMDAVDNYRARELRYFDGHLRTIESTDTSLLDGVWMNYFWMNETTLSANGDAHYQVQTQDGGAGVYARKSDGSLAVVARSRDQMAGGEWLIFPLTVTSGPTGEIWFTAYTWNNGVESLGLYLGTPQ